MAVADLISAWLAPFVAPIILYFARQYAIRKGWLSTPTDPSGDIHLLKFNVLRDVLTTLNKINGTIGGHQEVSVDNLNDIKEKLDRLIELSEAHRRDGGMLIYQRIPTPHVSGTAGHLNG